MEKANSELEKVIVEEEFLEKRDLWMYSKKSHRSQRSRRTHPKTRHDFSAALDEAQRLSTPWVNEAEVCLDVVDQENFREAAS